MVARTETVGTGPGLAVKKPVRAPLGREEKAELVWGDEAPMTDSLDLVGPEVERRRLQALPGRRSDGDIALEGRRALHDAGILRGSDYARITVTTDDGMATLSGHVGGSTDKKRAEDALRTVRGVVAVQNDLVADDDLVNLVGQALAHDERTRGETIFVAASHGVVILSGLRNSAAARMAAGECAGRVPFVRGVSNYIEAPGSVVDNAQERVVQPRVGQEVYASDMSLGRVEQVIINPRHRRVTAIVVRGRFPDRKRATPRMRTYEMPMEERRVVIPIAEISFVTETTVQVTLDGIAAARCSDFVPQAFMLPDSSWRPPYPFAADDCLWAKR